MAQAARAVLSQKEQEINALRQEALDHLEAQVRAAAPLQHPSLAGAFPQPTPPSLMQLGRKDAECAELQTKVGVVHGSPAVRRPKPTSCRTPTRCPPAAPSCRRTPPVACSLRSSRQTSSTTSSCSASATPSWRATTPPTPAACRPWPRRTRSQASCRRWWRPCKRVRRPCSAARQGRGGRAWPLQPETRCNRLLLARLPPQICRRTRRRAPAPPPPRCSARCSSSSSWRRRAAARRRR
jgi:hypothetical protein